VTKIAPDRCLTCSDDAVEAQVVDVSGNDAIVLVAGARAHIAIDLVPESCPGDLLLCHAGIALERLERSCDVPQVAPSHKVSAAVESKVGL